MMITLTMTSDPPERLGHKTGPPGNGEGRISQKDRGDNTPGRHLPGRG